MKFYIIWNVTKGAMWQSIKYERKKNNWTKDEIFTTKDEIWHMMKDVMW